MDYGIHIFEDPDTHEIVGITPEGKYHVRNCDLNAPHFIEERKERTKLWNLLESQPMRMKSTLSLPFEFQMLKDIAEKMIPKIPYLSGEALEKQRARKKALALLQWFSPAL